MLAETKQIGLTQNEVNNLIYVLIKFGFGKIQSNLSDPPNILIHEIMLEVLENPTIDNIIRKTLTSIIIKYKINLRNTQISDLKEHMQLTAKLFMAEPYELRSDLGDDKNVEEFITKH